MTERGAERATEVLCRRKARCVRNVGHGTGGRSNEDVSVVETRAPADDTKRRAFSGEPALQLARGQP